MKYICSVCGYVYDEVKENKAFADLPDDWVCPLCKAPKSAFNPEAAPAEEKKQIELPDDFEEDLTKLTMGELSALFSNLARGCEKQYQEEGRKLFAELADYYEAVTPAVEDDSIERLAELIKEDLDRDYVILNDRTVEKGDRGMLRAYTWGNKVTRILETVVERYKKEGDALLENTEIWVCSVCGFVYIGEEPPERCPVCKVPAYKFVKIEGRD